MIFTHIYRFKRFRSVSLLLSIVFVYLFFPLHEVNNIEEKIAEQEEKFDIMRERSTFTNPIYKKIALGGFKELFKNDLGSKCFKYFSALDLVYSDSPYVFDMEKTLSQQFSNLIYSRKRWIRSRIRNLKKELNKRGLKITKEQIDQIENDFYVMERETSDYERSTFMDLSHARIYGQCYLSEHSRGHEDDARFCQSYEKKLYPWLSRKYPIFEHWRGTIFREGEYPQHERSEQNESNSSECFLKKLLSKSNGKGIVITVHPEVYGEAQVRNIKNLIKVLRVLKNRLPVEIAYDSGTLSEGDKDSLISEARTEISSFPDSYGRYMELKNGRRPQLSFIASSDYPKQDLWFLDLSLVKNTKQHPKVAKSYLFNSPNFVFGLSSLFNSFEDAIMLSSDAIPLMDDFASRLFDDVEYKKSGMFFFRNPSYSSSRPSRFYPGYLEIETFVRELLMPSEEDQRHFGLWRRNSDSDTDRILSNHFRYLMDSTMIAINKKKIISGLLIHMNLQLYPVLSARHQVPGNGLDADFLWLGIQVAGSHERTIFNKEQALAVGVKTPHENKAELTTKSQEICSSSWGQWLNAQKHEIIYVTSHQLQNWVEREEEFRHDLEKKYSVSDGSGKKTDEGRDLYLATIEKNPLYIESAITPPLVDAPLYGSQGEPSFSWTEIRDFGGEEAIPFWCAYDLVNDDSGGKNGEIFDFSESAQAKFNVILDSWLQEFN